MQTSKSIAGQKCSISWLSMAKHDLISSMSLSQQDQPVNRICKMMNQAGVDIISVIVALVEDPRPLASVSTVWAAAVAVPGRDLVRAWGLSCPLNTPEDSFARGVFYLSTGHAGPHPGNFACTANATHQIWPFPVVPGWIDSLRKTYRRFPTQRDTGLCDVYRAAAGRRGLRAERNVPNDQMEKTSTIDDQSILDRLVEIADRFGPDDIIGDVFAVGPCFVALPEYPLRAFYPSTKKPDHQALMAVDRTGDALDGQNGWKGGAFSNWRPVEAPILRWVTPTCAAILARKQAEHTGFTFAYCSGVVWWHKTRGLRVRQFDPPTEPSTTEGWALPPVDAYQHNIPVCVLKWGSEWPYPVLAATNAAQEQQLALATTEEKTEPLPKKSRREPSPAPVVTSPAKMCIIC